MNEPIYCGYAGCYCMLPCQVEESCLECDLKLRFLECQKESNICPNGLGVCYTKNCESCYELKYAIYKKDFVDIAQK